MQLSLAHDDMLFKDAAKMNVFFCDHKTPWYCGIIWIK